MSRETASSAKPSRGDLATLLSALLLGFLPGACCNHQASAPIEPSARTEHVNSAKLLADLTVALVERDDDDKPSAQCAGVWVSQQDFLTAAHCVGAKPPPALLYEFFIHDPSAATPPTWAAVITSARDLDLALLRALFPMPPHRVASLALGPLHQGAFVQTVGHPVGFWWSYSSGDLAAIRRMPDGQPWVQGTLPINGGNSGGGLFNADDELIGLTSALVGTPDGKRTNGMSLFVHRDTIREFLTSQGL